MIQVNQEEFMISKLYNLPKIKCILKVEFDKTFIYTRWKHDGRNDFTNDRRFPINQLEFALSTLEPVCSDAEIEDIKVFLKNEKINDQLSLF